MKNNKGITLIVVVVMIIIIIIIATTSILGGSKLMTNSKKLVNAQEIASVKQAVKSRQAEVEMEGTVTPKGQTYPGRYSPLIANNTIEAKGWYQLNEDSLKELGITKLKTLFLVHYKRGIAISMEDEYHIEKYLVYTFIEKVSNEVKTKVFDDYIGEKLSNSTPVESGIMYIETSDPQELEAYGEGWYKVNKADIAGELVDDYPNVDTYELIKHSFLINYEDNKFVAVTPTMMAQ